MNELEAITMRCLMEAMEQAVPAQLAREECDCGKNPQSTILHTPTPPITY